MLIGEVFVKSSPVLVKETNLNCFGKTRASVEMLTVYLK